MEQDSTNAEERETAGSTPPREAHTEPVVPPEKKPETVPSGTSYADILLKWIGVITAIFGAIWSIYSYVNAAAREYQKPYYERQLRLYSEAAQNASILATSLTVADRQKAQERFWQLHWGELCMVEDAEVEKAMVAFGQELQRHPQPSTTDDLAELQEKSFALAHTLRKSLSKAWPIPGDIGRTAPAPNKDEYQSKGGI